MKRWLICLCVAMFVGCASDGGPGTESPAEGDAGNIGGTSGSSAGSGGAGGDGLPTAGVGGTGGVSGVGGSGGAGGVGGFAGQGGGAGGSGGAGGESDGGIDEDDASVGDEGFCTVECTGIGPDEGVAEACAAITEMDECVMHETFAFPSGCRWVTPSSEPCLAP